MSQFRVLTACEQVAGHLRDELLRGTWTAVMPGDARVVSSGSREVKPQAARGLTIFDC